MREIESRHGSFDILVNNAGITRDSTLRKMDRAQWDAVLDVNLGSAFNLCGHAVDGMQARGFGRVVNISSVSGQTGNFGQTNYAAAKAGLHGFTMSLAREVATKGITVNSVSPGYIETAMTGGDAAPRSWRRSPPPFPPDAWASPTISPAPSLSCSRRRGRLHHRRQRAGEWRPVHELLEVGATPPTAHDQSLRLIKVVSKLPPLPLWERSARAARRERGWRSSITSGSLSQAASINSLVALYRPIARDSVRPHRPSGTFSHKGKGKHIRDQALVTSAKVWSNPAFADIRPGRPAAIPAPCRSPARTCSDRLACNRRRDTTG